MANEKVGFSTMIPATENKTPTRSVPAAPVPEARKEATSTLIPIEKSLSKTDTEKAVRLAQISLLNMLGPEPRPNAESSIVYTESGKKLLAAQGKQKKEEAKELDPNEMIISNSRMGENRPTDRELPAEVGIELLKGIRKVIDNEKNEATSTLIPASGVKPTEVPQSDDLKKMKFLKLHENKWSFE